MLNSKKEKSVVIKQNSQWNVNNINAFLKNGY